MVLMEMKYDTKVYDTENDERSTFNPMRVRMFQPIFFKKKF